MGGRGGGSSIASKAAAPSVGLPEFRRQTRDMADDLVYAIERDIREAHFLELERSGEEEYSSFSDWRGPLDAKYGRENVDRVIRDLGAGGSPDGGFEVVQETNQKILTQAQRAGAVSMGGQPNHHLSLRQSRNPRTPKLVTR